MSAERLPSLHDIFQLWDKVPCILPYWSNVWLWSLWLRSGCCDLWWSKLQSLPLEAPVWSHWAVWHQPRCWGRSWKGAIFIYQSLHKRQDLSHHMPFPSGMLLSYWMFQNDNNTSYLLHYTAEGYGGSTPQLSCWRNQELLQRQCQLWVGKNQWHARKGLEINTWAEIQELPWDEKKPHTSWWMDKVECQASKDYAGMQHLINFSKTCFACCLLYCSWTMYWRT